VNVGTYAQNTNVSSELSRLEIEKTLIRYGANGFAYATGPGRALIGFKLNGRQVRFLLPLPDINFWHRKSNGRAMGREDCQ